MRLAEIGEGISLQPCSTQMKCCCPELYSIINCIYLIMSLGMTCQEHIHFSLYGSYRSSYDTQDCLSKTFRTLSRKCPLSRAIFSQGHGAKWGGLWGVQNVRNVATCVAPPAIFLGGGRPTCSLDILTMAGCWKVFMHPISLKSKKYCKCPALLVAGSWLVVSDIYTQKWTDTGGG